jgi:hypothetical protein
MGLLGCTDASPCMLHTFWQETLEQILARLRSVSLADLARHHDDPAVERFRLSHGVGGPQEPIGVPPVQEMAHQSH